MATVTAGAPAHRSGWTITEGIVLIIVGLVAVASPLVTAQAAAIALPWLVLIEGILLLASAFGGTVVGSKGWTITLGVIAIVCWAALLARPVATFLSLPLVLGFYLAGKGIAQFVAGMQMTEGKGWVYAAAVLNVLFAILVWMAPFGSAMLFTGIYVGVSFLCVGALLLMLPAAPAPEAMTDMTDAMA